MKMLKSNKSIFVLIAFVLIVSAGFFAVSSNPASASRDSYRPHVRYDICTWIFCNGQPSRQNVNECSAVGGRMIKKNGNWTCSCSRPVRPDDWRGRISTSSLIKVNR